MKSGDKKAWRGIRTATDKGSFIISLENNKPTLINIINTVEIWFVPFPIEFTKSQFLCPPPPGYTQGGVSGEDMAGLSMNFGSALPWNIKFLAKDGEQIIVNSKDEQGSLKIVVRKIKND